MKKSIKSSKSKFMIVINLFLIFILMTVSVYAWFASNVDNRVNLYEIEVQADNKLELSFDGKEWGGTLDLNNLKNGTSKVMETMKFVEVTGDGSTFNIPKLIQNTNYAEVNTSYDFTPAQPNVNYLQFTVYMRSKDLLNVYLSPESKASPVSEEVIGANCGNATSFKIKDGGVLFSKDCIVGALRVSYLDASNSRQIWITNPEFFLNNNKGENDYSMSINSSDYSGSNFQWNNPNKHFYYDSNKNFVNNYTGAITSLGVMGEAPLASTKLTALTADGTVAEGALRDPEYNYGAATFTVWLEGCDTEARAALLGGKFALSLAIDSYTSGQ